MAHKKKHAVVGGTTGEEEVTFGRKGRGRNEEEEAEEEVARGSCGEVGCRVSRVRGRGEGVEEPREAREGKGKAREAQRVTKKIRANT